MASWRTPSNSAIGNRSTQHLRVDRLAQTPFLVTMDLCFSVLASIYNQLEKEEAWKKGESPKRRDIMLQLDISFLLYCFVFLPKALPVVPPRSTSELFLTLFLRQGLRAKLYYQRRAGVYFPSAVNLRARSVSLSLFCLSLSLISSRMSVPRECRCWTSSVLASVGPNGVFVRVFGLFCSSFFFVVWCRRGGGF
jgi:hypothetical protein